MKKKDVITIILAVLFVALLVAGIILIVKDMELSHVVAAEANSTQQKILEIPETDPDFHEFIRLITVQEHATVNKHINDFVEAFETKKVLAY